MNLKKTSKEQVFKITAIPIVIIVSLCSLITLLGNDNLWSSVGLISNDGKENTAVATVEGREDIRLTLEIAGTDRKRADGLMNRQFLPQDEGMLFVFDSEQNLAFWMKDTYIPLDIAFLDADKNIINIHGSTEPLNTQKRYRSNSPAMYAIETNSGWFERNELNPGDSFNFFLD